jgi:hypothetical protein
MQQDSSFSEEKEAKRLLFLRLLHLPGPFFRRCGFDLGTCAETEVFCFFSSEKKTPSFTFLPPQAAPAPAD